MHSQHARTVPHAATLEQRLHDTAIELAGCSSLSGTPSQQLLPLPPHVSAATSRYHDFLAPNLRRIQRHSAQASPSQHLSLEPRPRVVPQRHGDGCLGDVRAHRDSDVLTSLPHHQARRIKHRHGYYSRLLTWSWPPLRVALSTQPPRAAAHVCRTALCRRYSRMKRHAPFYWVQFVIS